MATARPSKKRMRSDAIWPRACRVCSTSRNLVKASAKPGGVDTICRACKGDVKRLTPVTPEQRSRAVEADRRWAQRNPDKKATARDRSRRKLMADPLRQAIGAAVKAWRTEHGLSQADLADLLRVPRQRVCCREIGREPWPADHLDKLRRAGAAIPMEV